jgi:hypothetical protein
VECAGSAAINVRKCANAGGERGYYGAERFGAVDGRSAKCDSLFRSERVAGYDECRQPIVCDVFHAAESGAIRIAHADALARQ